MIFLKKYMVDHHIIYHNKSRKVLLSLLQNLALLYHNNIPLPYLENVVVYYGNEDSSPQSAFKP